MFNDNEIGIIVVLENSCIRDDLLAQHGISFRISYFGKVYLFDCGQVYKGLEHNLNTLNLDVDTIKSIIISHDHRDHCYSLGEFFKNYQNKTLIVPEDFSSFQHKNVIKISKHIELEPQLYTTGPLNSKDKIQEQSLVIDLKKRGLVIVVGCSHPGIENIVTKAIEITGNNKISGIIGGLHLVESSQNDIKNTIKYLKSLKLKFLIPGHCTGEVAITSIKQALGNKVKLSPIGSIGTGNIIHLSPKFSFDMCW